ncbi:MAG: hypothetical protein C4527_06790 [Candidatus Omnitrophota bacterium]|jgi:serine phosphatase RsbU (regulator of sigma subunit)|nr:MAG: hypothetical protein C4527_06790 [Candidatus Omnitrophota bacterium]
MKIQEKRIKTSEIFKILQQKKQDWLNSFDRKLLETLVKHSTVELFDPEEILVKQHDPSDSLYLVLQGRCTFSVDGEPLGFLESGDLVGEMGVIQDASRSATVTAIEPTSALHIPAQVFRKMLFSSPVSTWIMNLLVDRLRDTSGESSRDKTHKREILQDYKQLARVQRSLLPETLPDDPRMRIHVYYNPCVYAGGDYYDAIMLDENRLFLIIADVTGHGAQASITMAIVRSFIHQINLRKTPQTILKQLNRYLIEYGPSHHFVTAQAAVIDLENRMIQFAYAGHPFILHLHGDVCQPLVGPRSYFLRFTPDIDVRGKSIALNAGDRLGFYTDGVIDTFDVEGRRYDLEGLEAFLVKTCKKPVSSLPHKLEEELEKFREGSPIEDDITFLVVEIV